MMSELTREQRLEAFESAREKFDKIVEFVGWEYVQYLSLPPNAKLSDTDKGPNFEAFRHDLQNAGGKFFDEKLSLMDNFQNIERHFLKNKPAWKND